MHQNQCHRQCHYMASCLAAFGIHRQWHWHCQRRYKSKLRHWQQILWLWFLLLYHVGNQHIVIVNDNDIMMQRHCKLGVDLLPKSTRSIFAETYQLNFWPTNHQTDMGMSESQTLWGRPTVSRLKSRCLTGAECDNCLGKTCCPSQWDWSCKRLGQTILECIVL